MNMKCNSCSLSLLLFLALLLLGYTYWWSFPKKEQSNSEFDYLRLVFIWPNSYCNVPGGNCVPPVPEKKFTLHGFWPEKDDGQHVEYCSNTTMPDKTLDILQRRLVETWPNLRAWTWEQSKEFYKEQWSKHGTCSESKLDQKEYLETALNLADKYDLYSILENNKPDPIIPDPSKLYHTDDILNVIKKRVKKWPDVKCNTRPTRYGKEYQLYEIHLCYKFENVGQSEKLVKINCDGVARCEGEEKVYYPNNYATALSQLPSEKEMVSELEDKADL